MIHPSITEKTKLQSSENPEMNNNHHTMKDLFAALDPMSLINLSHQKKSLASSLNQSKQEEEFKEKNSDRAQQDSKSVMGGMNSSTTTASFHYHTMEDLFEALDPMSSNNLSRQNSSMSLQSNHQNEFIVTNFSMQRGPRYNAYAELRELKLQMKLQPQQQEAQQYYQQRFPIEVESTRAPLPPPIKKTSRSSSIVGRSVPDFSSVLRKENRKPTFEMTPPTSKSRVEPKSELRGSKSASGAEKRSGGSMMARKSYANIEELQGLTTSAANAINGEGRRGGKNVRSVLGSRQYG